MARGKVIVARDEPFNDGDFTTLDEEKESTKKVNALIESENDDFINLEECGKQRSISFEITAFRETLAEEYADAEYRRFLREKDKYADFDEFYREDKS